MQIFKEKHGTFAYRVEIGRNPKTGRRLQKYKGGFRREKDAKAAAQQIEEEVRQHRYVPDSQTTFGDFAEEWIQIYGETVKPGSVRIRRHQVGILLMYFEQVPLQLITPKKYGKEGVHGAARMIFKKARQYGLMRTDPSEFFSLPREKSGNQRGRRSGCSGLHGKAAACRLHPGSEGQRPGRGLCAVYPAFVHGDPHRGSVGIDLGRYRFRPKSHTHQ